MTAPALAFTVVGIATVTRWLFAILDMIEASPERERRSP